MNSENLKSYFKEMTFKKFLSSVLCKVLSIILFVVLYLFLLYQNAFMEYSQHIIGYILSPLCILSFLFMSYQFRKSNVMFVILTIIHSIVLIAILLLYAFPSLTNDIILTIMYFIIVGFFNPYGQLVILLPDSILTKIILCLVVVVSFSLIITFRIIGKKQTAKSSLKTL